MVPYSLYSSYSRAFGGFCRSDAGRRERARLVLAELADYAWLTAEESSSLLTELAADDAPLHRQLQRLRKVVGPERAGLAVEQVRLRQRARSKFGPLASRMFFTETALEQATDLWIARYKAGRFPGGEQAVDYCTGIGGDLLALAERGSAIGYDVAPTAAHLAEANLRAAGLAEAGEVRVADVADHPPSVDQLWHLDPERRKDGRRSTQLEWHSPPQEVLEQWLASAPHGAIKLAPAAEVPDSWQQQCELEWISRNRECRQLVVWSGRLAEDAGRRRATRVASPTAEQSAAVCDSFLGQPNAQAETSEQPEQYVYDTDPAIRAARLTGSLACELGLKTLGRGECYLTSASLVAHPLTSCFRILDQLPLREKPLADTLRQRGIGTLEIKKRGVDVDPETLRRRLKLRGDQQATLLLMRLGKREIALVAERIDSTESSGGN